jgi:AcrR family transcriptional regulator
MFCCVPRRYSTTSRQAQTSATQRRIVEAVEELLLEVGPDQVTLKGVSGRSGVALATLYKHFESRSELLAAAYRTLAGEIEGFADGLAPACDGTSGPVEQLQALIAYSHDALQKDEARLARIPTILGVVEIEQAQRKAGRRRRAVLRDILRPIAEAEELSIPLPEAVALGVLVTSPGLWGDLVSRPELSREQAIELAWQFLALNVFTAAALSKHAKVSATRPRRARTA